MAVLTDLQNIYPAENRPLATDILNSGGVLLPSQLLKAKSSNAGQRWNVSTTRWTRSGLGEMARVC